MLDRIVKLTAAFCLGVTLTASASGVARKASDDAMKNLAAERQEKREKSNARDDAVLRAKAERLHREAIVIDTHNDFPEQAMPINFDLGMNGVNPDGTLKTHTDLRRLKEGGLDGVFFAVYVAKEFVNKKPAEGGGAARRALDVIDFVQSQVRRHSDSVEMAYTADDIRRIAKKGKIAALMGIEGGHAIEDSLAALRLFHQLGVRYMTLTHTNTNDWADAEGDANNPNVKHHNGLTDFGKEVVREMNRIGMMVDVSHVADKTFYDVIATTRAPIIASHSSARALAPHPRNMTDDMLRAMSQNGGVVMVNFYDGFIDPRKAGVTLQMRAKTDELAKQYPNDPQRVQEELRKWRATQPTIGRTPLSVLMDHIEHVIKVAGIDHVGLGADLDGIPLTGTPEGFDDVSKYPLITYELLKRGYSETDVKKVLGENLLRVMAEVEHIAKTQN